MSTDSSMAGTRMSNKVAIVTGSSSGIGRAIALAIAAQGAKLVVCADLNPSSAQADLHEGGQAQRATVDEIIAQHGADKACYVRCDVSRSVDVDAAVSEATRRGGRLDVIINNAGIFIERALIETSDEDWNKSMSINATGAFNGCRASIRQFLKQDLDEDGFRGVIVNVSSIAALQGLFTCAGYCASKSAIVGLTRAIAVEYAASGVRANAICPGFTKTNMLEPMLAVDAARDYFVASAPAARMARPAEISRVALNLASNKESSFMHGAAIPVDGGTHIK